MTSCRNSSMVPYYIGVVYELLSFPVLLYKICHTESISHLHPTATFLFRLRTRFSFFFLIISLSTAKFILFRPSYSYPPIIEVVSSSKSVSNATSLSFSLHFVSLLLFNLLRFPFPFFSFPFFSFPFHIRKLWNKFSLEQPRRVQCPK